MNSKIIFKYVRRLGTRNLYLFFPKYNIYVVDLVNNVTNGVFIVYICSPTGVTAVQDKYKTWGEFETGILETLKLTFSNDF